TSRSQQGRSRGRRKATCPRCFSVGARPDGDRARKGQPEARPAPDRNGRPPMKSPVVKRSIVIAGHKTSVSLEDAFWKGLKEIAGDRDITLSDLVATIDTDRRHGNLSSAIRLFVLDHYRGQTSTVETKSEPATARDMIGIR